MQNHIEHENQNTHQEANQGAILTTKMAYERCENYMGALRAILYVYQDTTSIQDSTVESLQHVINLMSLEINALNATLNYQE